MSSGRRRRQDELTAIDRTMRAVSGAWDPEELVGIYRENINELRPAHGQLAVSLRGVPSPHFIVTRSSRFTEDLNPWTRRERPPRLSCGALGEIAYANAPVIIDDLPARLAPDDPARFQLEGVGSLVASPQYDGGEAMNVTMMLMPPGPELDRSTIPMLH